MNPLTKLKYLQCICCITLLAACQKDDPEESTETGQITFHFDNRAGDQDLQLNTPYRNASGEIFAISKLKYYVSNFTLTPLIGRTFTIPPDSSYFLVDEADETSQEVTIRNIPAGDYSKMTFVVGVDADRSVMDMSKRKGVLDTIAHADMFWSVKSGYIFLNMEGTLPATPANDKFDYHIGGFGGAINNLKTISIDMGSARALVRNSKSPKVHLYINIMEFFESPVNISISEHPQVMLSDFSKTVSANYADMFTFNDAEN
jgi:hypothetical protein